MYEFSLKHMSSIYFWHRFKIESAADISTKKSNFAM